MTAFSVRLDVVDFSDVIQRVQNIFTSLVLALPNVVLGVLAFLAFWGISWLVAKFVEAAARRAGRPRGLQVVLSRLAGWSILAFGLLVGLTIIFPTITPASLFGTLGVSGVVIGFAFRDIFPFCGHPDRPGALCSGHVARGLQREPRGAVLDQSAGSA